MSNKSTVREAAYAGTWYSDNPAKLEKSIREYMASAPQLESTPRMLISPHAGHPYSGPVAGKGYGTLEGDIDKVILLGPSHRVRINQAVVPSVDSFETPLGRIPLDTDLIGKLKESRLIGEGDRAHAVEHSLEIQLPFLQVALSSFKLVPIMMLDIDPAALAELLLPYIDDRTLVVASSDFAHVHDYDKCKQLDKRSVSTIMEGDRDGFIEACGEMPIRVVMHLAGSLGMEPKLLDTRNSQDITGGGGGGYVVGYASIVYVKANGGSQADGKTGGQSDAGDGGAGTVPPQTQDFLLGLARQSLEAAVRGENVPDPDSPPEDTHEEQGCFVTLTKNGQLRGCIGYIEPIKPLYKAVAENARNAALRDPRFPPVKPDELDEIKVEVSVLTKPRELVYDSPEDLLDKLVPGRDGIILRKGYHQSTFLPQVWDQLPDKEQFLQRLARKAGMPADGWKDAEVKRYFSVHFDENR